MQPRLLAIIIVVLPLLTVNAVYLISAFSGQVPWCFPYLEGCTSISRAARKSDAIFLFRPLMIAYAVMLIYYWYLIKLWLKQINQQSTHTALLIFALGVTGAVFLILYVNFLGSEGVMYRFMRHYGVIIYFSFTPLAQVIMLNHLYKLKKIHPEIAVSFSIIYYQVSVVALILLLAIVNLLMVYSGNKTFESESMVEWNFSLLLALLFAGTIPMWKNFRLKPEIHHN